MDSDSDSSVISLNDIDPQSAVTDSYMLPVTTKHDTDSLNNNQNTYYASRAVKQSQVPAVSPEKPRYCKPQRKKKRRHRKLKRQNRKELRDSPNVLANRPTVHKNRTTKANGGRSAISVPEQQIDLLPRFDKTKKIKCRLGKIVLNYSGNIDHKEEERIKNNAIEMLKTERKIAQEVKMINNKKKTSEKIEKKYRQRKDRQRKSRGNLMQTCCIS